MLLLFLLFQFSPRMDEPANFPVEQVKRDIRDLVALLRRLSAHYDQQQGGGPRAGAGGDGELDQKIKSTLKAMVNYLLKSYDRGTYLEGQLAMYCVMHNLGSDQLAADWTRVKEKILEDASKADKSKSHTEAFENCIRAVRDEDFEAGGHDTR